ncbi:MAG: SprB repeat-containing protein, partial [Flavobacteriales bacterium]|nr:SprB repeat-containing protein [Flavobacteriales bacterium]
MPYYCTGDVVAYTPTISNPAGYTLQYSFTDVLTTSGVPAPWEVGFSGAAPIPGAAIDPATGEITFTAPNQFGNYIVGIQIDMFDGGGNLVGTVLESLTFTIRLCDNSVTAFTAPGVLSAHSDVTVISGTHLEVCAGDSLCFTVEAANANPFRSITLTDDFLDAANFPDGEVVSNGTNPVQAEYCALVPNDATGSFTITIDAMDDACVMPTSDQLVITVDISTTLFTSVLDTVICAGEMLPLLASGDSDYSWNLVSGSVEAPGFVGTGGIQNITPLSPLEIEVIANNAATACNWRDTILVDVSLYALPGIVTDETCNGNDGQIDLEVFGGDGPYQYSWFPGGAIMQDISGLTGGTYTVTVIDQSMLPTCMRDTTFTVGSAPPPSGSIAGDATICEGDCTDITFTLSGTAPFSVTLMNLTSGAPEVVPAVVDQDVFQVCPTTTTVYELQAVTGSNTPSCTDNTTSQVTVTVKPTVTASFIDPGTLCEGEAINLEIDIDQPGTFDVDYVDADGNNQSMAVADGATIPVTVDDPTTTLSVESVAYQTAPLCANTNQALLNIDVDPLPTATISGGTTICAGENVVLHFDLTGTGPWDVTYTENNGAPIVMNILFNSFDWLIAGGPAATTNYCITNVLDLGTNCDQDVNSCAEVVVNTLPTGSLAADATICAGETEALEFTLNGNGPFNVTLEDGVGNDMGVPAGLANGATFDVTPASTETYCLTEIVDVNSCTTTLNSCVDITVNPLPTVDISGNTIICDGSCYDLAIGNMSGNAPWNVDWELRNATDDSVIDSGTEAGMINGDVIQFCPNEDAYVVITSITDSSVPACATTSPVGQFDIQVNTYTTVSVSQDSTICLGGSPLLTFCFSDYDAGDTFSLDIDNASSFNLPAGSLGADGCYNFAPSADPVITTTYSILTFTNDNNICTQIDNADVTIQVTDVPTATLDLDQTICPGTDATLTVNIPTAGGPFDIQVEEGSTGDILTFEDIADQFTFTVSPAANDSYELIYIADSTTAAACNSAPASLVNITLFDAPAPVLPMDTLCADTGEEFQIAFEIAGGDPLTYNVNPTLGSDAGGVLSAGPPYIYTSGVMTAGDEETWEISDASGCTPYLLDINTFDCPVLTYSGTIDLTAQVFCSDGLVCATATGDEFLDGNDVLSFLIISDADYNSAVVYYISAANCWDVDIDLDMAGTLTYGTEYYLVAVAGNDQGNGLVDLGNPNISISEAMPFTILDTPTATISGDATICAGQTTTLTVDLTGTPEWNFEILQDGNQVGMVVAAQATTPYTVDVSNAGIYTIDTIDNTGCVGTTNGSATITVNPLPTADLTADGEICDGATWDFDIALTGTPNWDVVIAYDDGINGPVDINLNGITNAATQYTSGDEGTYTITSVTDGNSCVNTSVGTPVTLIVNDLPSAQWAFADSSYCEGADIDLDYLVTGAFPVDITYQLDGANDVVITTAADGSETVNTPGQYCITLVEDDNGCSVTPNLCINISEIVAPIADAGPDVVVCSSVDQIIGTPGDPALDY